MGETSVPFFLDCRALGRHPAPELEPCLSELASQVCSRCTIQISPIQSPPNVQVLFLLGITMSIFFLNRKKGPNKNIESTCLNCTNYRSLQTVSLVPSQHRQCSPMTKAVVSSGCINLPCDTDFETDSYAAGLQLIAKDIMVCKIKGFSEVRKDCSNYFAPLELL